MYFFIFFPQINYSGANNYIKNNKGEKENKKNIGYKYNEKKWNNYIYLFISNISLFPIRK